MDIAAIKEKKTTTQKDTITTITAQMEREIYSNRNKLIQASGAHSHCLEFKQSVVLAPTNDGPETESTNRND